MVDLDLDLDIDLDLLVIYFTWKNEGRYSLKDTLNGNISTAHDVY